MNMKDVYQSVLDILFRADEIDLENFKLGFVAGVLIFAIFAVILRLILLYINSGDKKSKGIKIAGDSGSIIISPNAVSDLVKSIGNGIKHIEVSKVKLLEANDESLYLDVYLIMDGGDTKFSEISSKFQNQVVETLKDKFGVQCVKNVVVHLDKILEVRGVSQR